MSHEFHAIIIFLRNSAPTWSGQNLSDEGEYGFNFLKPLLSFQILLRLKQKHLLSVLLMLLFL